MMRINLSPLAIVVILIALAGLPRTSWAGGSVACTVNSPAMAFGAYDAVTGTAITSSAVITVTCNHKNVGPWPIALNAGVNSAGSFNPRVMKSTTSTDTLNYNLYINTSYIAANIWGDGTAGTQTVSYTTNNVGPPSTASFTVNGQIPANQDPSGA